MEVFSTIAECRSKRAGFEARWCPLWGPVHRGHIRGWIAREHAEHGRQHFCESDAVWAAGGFSRDCPQPLEKDLEVCRAAICGPGV